jgi:uncharacterized UBP type Zn finger protein
MIPGPPGAVIGPANLSLNGSAPRCEHVDALAPVVPQSQTCPACQAEGTGWVTLRVCLTCGWVACSDDSSHQHALAHYEETDHPVTADLEPESDRRWCYVHRRRV